MDECLPPSASIFLLRYAAFVKFEFIDRRRSRKYLRSKSNAQFHRGDKIKFDFVAGSFDFLMTVKRVKRLY